MLKQRVITAIALLLVLLPALFYESPVPFVGIALVLISAAAWEWARLNGYEGMTAVFFGFFCATLCAGAWWFGLIAQPLGLLWIISGAIWVMAGAWMLRGGVAAWSTYPRVLRLVAGLFVLWLAWLAVAKARFIGVNFLLSILLLVWVADVFAYFAGRAFGGRVARVKLAPSISPGKSWEGVWGGMAGVVAIAFIWQWSDSRYGAVAPSLYTLMGLKGWWFLLISVLFMAAMSVVGDLFESLVKRSAGVKDSSGLLPGHGGVLDRIDALLPTLPLAMMLYSV